MSVDTLRETFHINRINSFELQDFLTAQTYRPEITKAKNHILSLENCTLQSVCTKKIQQGKSPKYASEGLKCIKPRNTNNMLVSLEDIDWIDVSTKEKNQNQKLSYSDIVITRSGSGTIGRASIYSYQDEVYTNDHLFIVRPDKADSHYVCSYLRSYYGQRLLESGISGSTGQLNLSNEHIKSLRLFKPDSIVQKYIGDKVRQAEKLRLFKDMLQENITSYFDGFHPSLDMNSKIYRAPINTLAHRLDADFYLPQYIELDDYFESKGKQVIELSSYVKNQISGPSIPSSKFYDSVQGVSVLQTKDIREYYINHKSCSKIEDLYAKELNRFEVGAGTLLMGMSGTIGRTALIFDEKEKFIINQRVAGLILKDKKIAGYLCAYLNHPFGKMQLNRNSVGGVQANISLEDIVSTKVLIDDRADAEEISDSFIQSLVANELSTQLIDAAITLVDALIEGQLTEDQLIQAQQALEDGDNTLDKAILSKLSSEGYAVEGTAPLFSDIDELYHLLASATATDSED